MAKYNWRTTLVGFCTGLYPLVQGLQSMVQAGQHVNWGAFMLGVGLIALGVVAGDAKQSAKPPAEENTLPSAKA